MISQKLWQGEKGLTEGRFTDIMASSLLSSCLLIIVGTKTSMISDTVIIITICSLLRHCQQRHNTHFCRRRVLQVL